MTARSLHQGVNLWLLLHCELGIRTMHCAQASGKAAAQFQARAGRAGMWVPGWQTWQQAQAASALLRGCCTRASSTLASVTAGASSLPPTRL